MTHYSPLVSAMVTLALTLFLTMNKSGMVVQDIPNERSLHDEPIPRAGGIALMAGILSGWVMFFKFLAWWIVLPALGLFVLSFLDDRHNLPVRTRLIGHFVAALVAVSGAGLFWLWMLPLLLCIVWMTNLYNFMDGSDGLAGGMTLFGFSFYGMAALVNGNEAFAMMNFSVGAAALGFLCYNFHPAKIFMGDSGSIPLGFMAATFGIWGWQQHCWPLWFPLLVFSPFVADASVTLLKRMLCRKKFWLAHREHYYQRLVQMGFGHRNVALFAYALMLAVGVSAICSVRNPTEWPWHIFLPWGGIYALLMLVMDRRWQAFQRRQHG